MSKKPEHELFHDMQQIVMLEIEKGIIAGKKYGAMRSDDILQQSNYAADKVIKKITEWEHRLKGEKTETGKNRYDVTIVQEKHVIVEAYDSMHLSDTVSNVYPDWRISAFKQK